MAKQRFYGKLSNVNLQGNGSNSVIRVTCNTTDGSNILDSVSDVTGYLGLASIREGMSLEIAGDFSGPVVVTDITGDTLTVDTVSSVTATSVVARVSPAPGNYHISASFYDPQSQVTVSDISGSVSDPLAERYAVLGQAATPIGTVIRGRFHKYTITEVLRGSNQYSNFEGYISWDEKRGTEEQSGDTLYQGASQILGIVSLTPNHSLGPIFADNIAGLIDLPPGTEVAAHQIDLEDYYDNIQTAVSGHLDFLSASYSGTQRIEFFTSSIAQHTASFFVDITGSILDDVEIVSGTMLRFSRLESGSFFDLDLADIDVTSSLHIKYTGSLITTSSMYLDFSKYFLVSESATHGSDKGLHIDLDPKYFDTFPYTGSADISGSMHIDTDPSGKSPLLITISSSSLAEEVALEVSNEGVLILGNHTGSLPTPVSGGLIYSEGCYFFSISS